MKDYYSLLSVAPDASVDDIKRAFRREIARYHPDKVHHLGAEFQALAAERAAELTEAYRVLMDAGLRTSYDHERGDDGKGPQAPMTPEAGAAAAAPAAEPPPRAGAPRAAAPSAGAAPPPRPADARETPHEPAEHPSRDAFVQRMSMSRFRDAIQRALEGVTSMPARGFEGSYLVKGKRSLFGKVAPERLLTAYVGKVTPEEIASLGQQALAARGAATAITVFALGDRLAPAADLSAALVAVRRRAPEGVTLLVVPVDVRDWSAMMPKEASAGVRAVIARLTAKD